jgi:hypothetical protein
MAKSRLTEPEPPDGQPSRFTRFEPSRPWWEDEQQAQRAIEQIRTYNICDWHASWGAGTPLEERRRLILEAGRPDLIQPEMCERFGIAQGD